MLDENYTELANTSKVELTLKINVNFVMFGAYKCKSSAVRFDSSGVNIDCITDDYKNDDNENSGDDNEDDSQSENSVANDVLSVRVLYEEMVEFRCCDDKQTLIVVIKPDNQWITKFQSHSMVSNGLNYRINFDSNDEREHHIIIEVKKTKSDDSSDETVKMSQMLLTFFAFLTIHTNLKICDETEMRETKKLVDNVVTLSRVRELTKQVESLRLQLNSDSDRSDAIIRLKISNFSKLKGRISSSATVLRDVSWSLMAMPVTCLKNGAPNKSLGLFLECDDSLDRSHASFEVSAEFRLISQSVERCCVAKKLRHGFSTRDNSRGFRQFYDWDKMLNEENGYISGDAVVVEVWLLVDVWTPVQTFNSQKNFYGKC